MKNNETLQNLFLAANDFMVNSIFWRKDWLVAEDNSVRNYPAAWIKKTIEFLKIIDAKTVVEIGSTRFALTHACVDFYEHSYTRISCEAPPDCQDGHSTYFWAREGFNVHTVDIDPRCAEVIEGMYKYHMQTPTPENLHIHIPQDGIEFLQNFPEKIDFLFLDGWDRGTNRYAEYHLEAFLAAEDKMAPKHIISIDDTDFDCVSGGKDKLVSPELIRRGYIPLLRGRQKVFFKGEW